METHQVHCHLMNQKEEPMLHALLDRVQQARAVELEGEEGAEAGFTLIELMVVLLILAILMAIAIPTFLGVTGSANNRAAQSNLTNALTAAESFYQSNNQSFNIQGSPDPTALQSSLQSSEPTFSWTSGNCTSSDTNCISVYPSSDGTAVILAAYSKTNECWFVLYSPTESPSTAFSSLGSTSTSSSSSMPEGTFFGETTTTGSTGCNASSYTSVSNWAASFGQVVKKT